MAELADALDSGSSDSNIMGVRVPSSAEKTIFKRRLSFFLFCSVWRYDGLQLCCTYGKKVKYVGQKHQIVIALLNKEVQFDSIIDNRGFPN